jgi:DNA repair exonuclease SbcCD nuclease subunit
MINFSSNKVACISDIHLGVHQDSQTWHDIAINFAYWLNGVLKEKNIKDIIIAGDIFHNRHEIGVNTIHTAHKFFDILKEYNIVAITGNHDCYYKDKSDVNSISILNNKNITIFQELRTYTLNNKSFTFCPWGVPVEHIPKSDIIIGHFEITNFKMNQHKICDHGVATESLLDKGKIIISGHFHYRDHRKYSNGRSILYLGSPYELDFGDRDQVKGVTILDTETLEVELIENNITPKHKKIKISDLTDGTIKLEDISSTVSNNFIDLCIDKSLNPQALDLILTKFNQYKPLHIRTDFNIFENVQLSATDAENFSIDIETALHEFVELLETEVPKKEILNKCLDLYKLSLTTNE